MSDSIENLDRKLQGVTTIKGNQKLGNLQLLDGSPVIILGNSKFNNDKISFGMPNMSALFLDYANKLYNESQKFFIYKNFNKDNDGFMHPKNEIEYQECIQKRIGVIIFSFLALESFTSDAIPDDFEYITKRGGTKKNKKEIEEKFDIANKIYNILPQRYLIEGEIDQTIKEKFESFKSIRNRLVHLKTNDKRSTNEETLRTIIGAKNFQNYTLVSKEIIGYFMKYENPVPRRFQNIPF